jgi:hypothetical protein
VYPSEAGIFVTLFTLDINVTVWARKKLSGNFVWDKLQGGVASSSDETCLDFMQEKELFLFSNFLTPCLGAQRTSYSVGAMRNFSLDKASRV